ncbi:restriction endonuclease subunit S [Aliarcobacter sp. ERUVET-7]|uniref:restriction endonuclease subunit S n=1 Tax=Aliarcobacter sp. ERUVET-7 TaxID=3429683 RepID=UPI003D6C5904
MGIIPEDWEVVRLGDIFEIKVGKDLDEKNYSPIKTDEHIYPIYSNTVENRGLYGYSKTKEYQGNSLTVVGRGIGLGTAFSRHHKFCAIGRLLVLQPKKKSNVDFISEYINFKMKIFDESSGIPQLTGVSFSTYLALNPPLKEQEKIAEILTTWDETITKQTELLRAKELQKKGLMQKLLSGEVRFSGFSDEWEEVRLGEIAEIYQPQTISQTELTDEGFDVYGANGIIGKYYQYNHELEQIAVTCRGNTCGTVNFTKPKSWITGNAMVINLDNSTKAIKTFIYYLFLNTNFTYLISGSGQPQITGNIKNHKLKLPSLSEQQKIAEVLSLADDEINLLKNELDELKLQKKALMQKLLTGQVRVKV